VADRGRVKSCSAFMDDGPPFGGNDAAGNFDSPGKVVRLRGQLKNTSSESLKTEFVDLSLQFCKEWVEEWKVGEWKRLNVCTSERLNVEDQPRTMERRAGLR
jgi:hypothetical protein